MWPKVSELGKYFVEERKKKSYSISPHDTPRARTPKYGPVSRWAPSVGEKSFLPTQMNINSNEVKILSRPFVTESLTVSFIASSRRRTRYFLTPSTSRNNESHDSLILRNLRADRTISSDDRYLPLPPTSAPSKAIEPGTPRPNSMLIYINTLLVCHINGVKEESSHTPYKLCVINTSSEFCSARPPAGLGRARLQMTTHKIKTISYKNTGAGTTHLTPDKVAYDRITLTKMLTYFKRIF
ncbi:hypothetical protein EVAR_32499_1 [Eumeta japonica]|uniref:Uncharacterized protein n=1 Tax=Eumeta variegata TaxID=151549 RepID=A0A4C1W7W1_EUMVA|nr:hypothetical protein EVAR_32499_1 [Eumeta japonica]